MYLIISSSTTHNVVRRNMRVTKNNKKKSNLPQVRTWDRNLITADMLILIKKRKRKSLFLQDNMLWPSLFRPMYCITNIIICSYFLLRQGKIYIPEIKIIFFSFPLSWHFHCFVRLYKTNGFNQHSTTFGI